MTNEYTDCRKTEQFWLDAEIIEACGNTELLSDGINVGIRTEDDETVYGYDDGMDAWSDVTHEASHPFAERR